MFIANNWVTHNEKSFSEWKKAGAVQTPSFQVTSLSQAPTHCREQRGAERPDIQSGRHHTSALHSRLHLIKGDHFTTCGQADITQTVAKIISKKLCQEYLSVT